MKPEIFVKIKKTCVYCNGEGSSAYHMCESCKGKGTVVIWMDLEDFKKLIKDSPFNNVLS